MSTPRFRTKHIEQVEDYPHLLVVRGRLVIKEMPGDWPGTCELPLPSLHLDHQKGDLVYVYDETAEGHEVRLPSGALAMTGGYFAIKYRGYLRPWPEHLDRLKRMLPFMQFTRSTKRAST